ncbi:MAG: hypothetical protein NWQ46_01260 [Spirosomaceae bacterium]|nr:hypothetical protein [Spirosomataceae bacterium]
MFDLAKTLLRNLHVGDKKAYALLIIKELQKVNAVKLRKVSKNKVSEIDDTKSSTKGIF